MWGEKGTQFAKHFPEKKKILRQTGTAQSGWFFSAFNQNVNKLNQVKLLTQGFGW